MVENMDNKIIECLRTITLQICSNNLENDLLKLEHKSVFKLLGGMEKINYVLEFADLDIIRAHEELQESKRLAKLTYIGWKEEMLKKFGEKYKKRDFLNEYQKSDETCLDFFRRMKIMGKKVTADLEWSFEVAYRGLRKNIERIQLALIGVSEIDERCLKIIEEVEKIARDAKARQAKVTNKMTSACYKCGESGHFANTCRGKHKSVNYIGNLGENIKEDTIYFFEHKFSLLVDTGSHFNFVTKRIIQKLNVMTIKLRSPIKLYTCLLTPFYIKEKIRLKFKVGERWFYDWFYIMPKRDDMRVILGNAWLNGETESTEPVTTIGTHKEAMEQLCKENKQGVKDYFCEIKTKEGVKVVDVPYKIPQALEVKIEAEVERLMKKNYIRESSSSWLNNIRPVHKEGGSIRLTTNLIKLNKLVELDNYSLPRIEELIYRLRDCKYFSKIDLKEGFFQIHLKEADKMKTAFRIKNKMYEWNRMPMGFKNSPAVFQRLMDKVLDKELGISCFVYVDDILIFGKSKEAHDKAFLRVCKLLISAGLTANEKKIEYCKEEVVFLGHRISFNKIVSQLDKVTAIKDYKRPEDKDEIRKFLGVVNYYRKFIENCAIVCEPLVRLLKNRESFIWSDEQELAFNVLKSKLLQPRCLYQPDFTREFILKTDASNLGLGAELSQKWDGVEHPIAFASRKLTDTKRNYGITEKEMLCVLWAMEHFSYFLLGREFTVFTDHKALEAFNTKGMIKSPRIARWLERIQCFNFNVIYTKPSTLEHVDALSRSHKEVDVIEEANRIESKADYIIKVHEDIVHRGAGATLQRIQEMGNTMEVTHGDVKTAIKNCIACKQYNPIRIQGLRYIESYSPGEKVAFDIVGPIEDKYIITCIDYFSRFAFAKVLSGRTANRIVKFLDEVNRILEIKTLISDAAKENVGKVIKEWAERNKIEHHITSPYHHQSNGRVERLNRTIQEGIRKQDQLVPLNKRLAKSVDVYNNCIHSALGITPIEARDVNDLDQTKRVHFNNRVEKYRRLFKYKEQNKLEVNSLVLVQDHVHKYKGQPKFNMVEEIVEILQNDCYTVKINKDRVKRHVTQLRHIPREDMQL